jgi:nitrogen fixation/metabolism regulation signal transduction histidine kinase
MTKKQLYLIGLTLLFFFLALGFDFYNQRTVGTQQYASIIEKHLHENEEEVEGFFKEKDFIVRQLSNQSTSEDFVKIESLYKKNYTLCIYLEDSLAFWTNNEVTPNHLLLKEENVNLHSGYSKLSNGHYEVLKKSFIQPGLGKYTVFGFIPIKYEYELESSYLENVFKADKNIPKQIAVSEKQSPVELKNNSGKVIAYLTATTSQVQDPIKQQFLFFLYICSFVFLGILINIFAKNISLSRPPWMGFAFLVATVFGIRFVTMQMNFTSKFTEISFFKQNFHSSYLGNSLGDLVINILLLFWIMVFFHTEYRVRPVKGLTNVQRFGLTTLNYFSIILGILMISNVFQQLVFNTDITFNFDHIFSLDRNSFIAIMASLLLLVALFLFSQRIMETILKLGLKKFVRLGALGLASLLAIPIIIKSNSDLPVVEMVIIGYMFNLIFDIYVDNNRPNFIWLVIWLVVFALIPSILLFKYNNDMDFGRRLKYADKLSYLKDKMAEESLEKVKKEIKSDQELKDLLKPFPFQANPKYVLPIINKHFTDNIYLHNNYQYDFHAYTKFGSALDSFPSAKEKLEIKLGEATSTGTNDLKFLSQPNNKNTYLLSFNFFPEGSPNYPISLVLEVERNRRDQSKVFTELLIEKQYKDLNELGIYEYAIYNNNESLIYKEGESYDDQYEFDAVPTPLENPIEINDGIRSHLVYRAPNQNLVVISKELPTARRIITLFAFLFVLLLFVILLLVVFNSIFKSLPSIFNFTFDKVMSIRTRIQMAVIVLTVIFFFSIGFVTVRYFSEERENYHESRLDRKGKAILMDTNLELEDYYSRYGKKDFDYDRMLKRISSVHRMDVNIYDKSGTLISSSESDVFNKGIVSRSMDAMAFNALSRMNKLKYTQEEEKVGSLTYKAAYLPLTLTMVKGNEIETETVAYMGLPYYSKQRELRDDVNVFMGTLLNLYVFLLLIAGAVAIGITNSITRPIARIGEKLKEFKLGKRNEPLEWQSKDELGDLIEEYNRLIKKVEESAEKLAHQEREGAWREMAKQVAHEIKNPLTPMKLSIQYLLHAYRSNPEDISPLLKRVSGTLIEQIDNLASIASEFSNFAKMPRADNQKLVVNDLVKSVFDFFNEGSEMIDLSLELPEIQIFVFADKNHLIQVLNNLIKNATQAIPDHRRGNIVVSLHQRDQTAIIKVKDNGTGISEDKWNKVFVPNFTTKNSGTGLGLAISKNIIESVDGKIHFDSIVDVGTEFYVELPIVEIRAMEEV